jgi:hypothetical protein
VGGLCPSLSPNRGRHAAAARLVDVAITNPHIRHNVSTAKADQFSEKPAQES